MAQAYLDLLFGCREYGVSGYSAPVPAVVRMAMSGAADDFQVVERITGIGQKGGDGLGRMRIR